MSRVWSTLTDNGMKRFTWCHSTEKINKDDDHDRFPMARIVMVFSDSSWKAYPSAVSVKYVVILAVAFRMYIDMLELTVLIHLRDLSSQSKDGLTIFTSLVSNVLNAFSVLIHYLQTLL
jgi:hypothetical protein